MSVDLVLDLVRSVRHVNGRVGIRGRHLGLGTLQSRQELAVQEAWLGVFEFVCYISSQPELSARWVG